MSHHEACRALVAHPALIERIAAACAVYRAALIAHRPTHTDVEEWTAAFHHRLLQGLDAPTIAAILSDPPGDT